MTSPEARSFISENTRERERLRALVERLDEGELRMPVNEFWTVAGVFGHIAFWDARVLALADKLERGVPFSSDDNDPEDVDWINDASRPLIHAVPPKELARAHAADRGGYRRSGRNPPDRPALAVRSG